MKLFLNEWILFESIRAYEFSSLFSVFYAASCQRLLESYIYCTRCVIRLCRINKLEVVTTKTRVYYFPLQIFRRIIPIHTSFFNALLLFPSPPIIRNHCVYRRHILSFPHIFSQFFSDLFFFLFNICLKICCILTLIIFLIMMMIKIVCSFKNVKNV